jgi:hypothetical protein
LLVFAVAACKPAFCADVAAFASTDVMHIKEHETRANTSPLDARPGMENPRLVNIVV